MYWWYIDYISIKLSLRNRKNKITHTGFWAASPLSTSVEALLFQSLHPPSLDFLQSPQRRRLPARVLCLSIQKHLPSCCAGGWKPWNSGPGSTYLSVFKGEPGSQCEGRVKRFLPWQNPKIQHPGLNPLFDLGLRFLLFKMKHPNHHAMSCDYFMKVWI